MFGFGQGTGIDISSNLLGIGGPNQMTGGRVEEGKAGGTSASLIKTPETCYSEADCVANYHVWWQEGMGNPPTCHANPPESWLQVGGNQQMLLVSTIGIAAVLGVVGLWWYTKGTKE